MEERAPCNGCQGVFDLSFIDRRETVHRGDGGTTRLDNRTEQGRPIGRDGKDPGARGPTAALSTLTPLGALLSFGATTIGATFGATIGALAVTLGALLSFGATIGATFGALTVTLGALLLSLGATLRSTTGATALSTSTPGKDCRWAGDEHHREDEQQDAARGDVHL
jgi:hypothetical protein